MYLRLLFIGSLVLLSGLALVKCDDETLDEEEGKVDDDVINDKESVTETNKDLDEEELVPSLKPSPDVETVIHFTKPTNSKELPAAALVRFLIGFTNKASTDMIVESLSASFRYPMDYNFFIRNYSDAVFNRPVQPNTEATFDYAFFPAEDLAGRPFGLSVLLNYVSANGTRFQSAVFNETVSIIEDESGFNPETGFLYIFIACLVILLLLLGQQFLKKMRRKHGMTKKSSPVEMGTSSNSDVDWEWIPKEHLNIGKSPKLSPKQSPKQRKTKKVTAGSSGGESD